MIFDYQFRNYNFRALIYMILLSVLGILVVGSASNQDRSSDKTDYRSGCIPDYLSGSVFD